MLGEFQERCPHLLPGRILGAVVILLVLAGSAPLLHLLCNQLTCWLKRSLQSTTTHRPFSQKWRYLFLLLQILPELGSSG